MFRLPTLEPEISAYDHQRHAIVTYAEPSAEPPDISHDFEPALADPALAQFDAAMTMTSRELFTWVIGSIAKGVKNYLVKTLELDGDARAFEPSDIPGQQEESQHGKAR